MTFKNKCLIEKWHEHVHFYMLMNTTKGMKSKYKFVSPFKYFNEHSSLEILYIFVYSYTLTP